MRVNLKLKSSRQSVNDQLGLLKVQADMWRDFFFRIWKPDPSGDPVNVRLYQYEADARAGNANYLGSGAGSSGVDQVITITKKTAAAFDFGSMKIRLTVVGTLEYAVYAHTAAVGYYLQRQIHGILEEYRKANEAIAVVKKIVPGTAIDEPVFPTVAIDVAGGILLAGSRDRFHRVVGVSFVVATQSERSLDAYYQALMIAEQIASIAVDEQRTWGGMATYTKLDGNIGPPVFGMAGVPGESELAFWTAEVPVIVGFPEVISSDAINYRDPLDPNHGGGKYSEPYE